MVAPIIPALSWGRMIAWAIYGDPDSKSKGLGKYLRAPGLNPETAINLSILKKINKVLATLTRAHNLWKEFSAYCGGRQTGLSISTSFPQRTPADEEDPGLVPRCLPKQGLWSANKIKGCNRECRDLSLSLQWTRTHALHFLGLTLGCGLPQPTLKCRPLLLPTPRGCWGFFFAEQQALPPGENTAVLDSVGSSRFLVFYFNHIITEMSEGTASPHQSYNIRH